MIIRDQILEAAKNDGILTNGRLPSEDELSKMFSASRATVRSALQHMEYEGILEKKHGTGNFLHRDQNAKVRNAAYSLTYLTSNVRPKVSEYDLKITHLDSYIAAKLGVEPGTDALELLKRIKSDELEIVCMHEFIPIMHLRYVPNASDKIMESIYSFFVVYGNSQIKEVITDVLPVAAEDTPFRALEGITLMQEEVFLDTAGKPVAFSHYYMNSKVVRPNVVRDHPPIYYAVV